jgi:hypothetical protein
MVFESRRQTKTTPKKCTIGHGRSPGLQSPKISGLMLNTTRFTKNVRQQYAGKFKGRFDDSKTLCVGHQHAKEKGGARMHFFV